MIIIRGLLMPSKFKIVMSILLAALISASSCFAKMPFTEKEIYPADKSDSDSKGKFKTIKEKVITTFKEVKDKVKDKIDSLKKKNLIEKAIKIPGYENKKFVCQGIASFKVSDKKYALLAYYPKTDHTVRSSQLIVVDLETEEPVARFSLYDAEGKKYTGHAGGVAIAGKYIWVASGYKIRGFSKDIIVDFIKNEMKTKEPADITPKSFKLPAKMIYTQETYAVDTKASYISFDGTYLWVGDFVNTKSKDYGAIKHHTKNTWDKNTWIAGYKVDDNGMPTSTISYSYKVGDDSKTAYKPDRVICCREKVQGMAVFGDYIALSLSFGAFNSKLAIYKSPLGKEGKKLTYSTESGDQTTEAYGLNDYNWVVTHKMPAGSEDLEFDGDYLYMPFEAGSPNFKAWRLNPTIKIDDRFYLMNPEKLVE